MTRSHNSRRGIKTAFRFDYGRKRPAIDEPTNLATAYSPGLYALAELGLIGYEREELCDWEWEEGVREFVPDEAHSDGSTLDDDDCDSAWVALSDVDGTPHAHSASDAASEWDVVSADESVWTDPLASTDAAPSPWDDCTADDAALARAIQDEEWAPTLRLGARLGARRNAPAAGGGLARLGALQPSERRALEARLGACVVCHEHACTVAFEPCGHLATCATCAAEIACAYGGRRCIICRTPGKAVHLLDGIEATVQLVGAPRVELAAAAGPLPRPEPLSCANALFVRRKMRALRRQERALPSDTERHYDLFSPCCHNYRYACRLPRSTWTPVVRRCNPWLGCGYGLGRSSNLWQPSDAPIAQLHSKEALRAARRALKSRRDACRVERAEERELARAQQRAEAAELARALAAAVAVAAGSACAACGERDACMLELKCGHASLCRECWEADHAAGPGAAARRPCAQCGGARERGHAIQLFRA